MEDQDFFDKKLLLEFHNQFSINHNHQQALFVQILGAVIIVFTGYGYVLVNTLDRSNIPFDERLLPITAMLVIVVMSFLSFILINQGWSFRSAQKIIKKIRMNILNDNYPLYFNGYGDSLEDLPDFYGINLYILEILKIFIAVVTGIIHATICTFVISMIAILLISVIMERYYYCHRKIKTNSEEGIREYIKCKLCGKVFKEEDMVCLGCARKRK